MLACCQLLTKGDNCDIPLPTVRYWLLPMSIHKCVAPIHLITMLVDGTGSLWQPWLYSGTS